jgi:hypothetical protein
MSASMEKPKQSNWLDKIKLLAAAIGAAVTLFFLQALLHDGIWLSTGWQYFAMGAVVYMTGVGVLLYKRHLWRRCGRNPKIFALATGWIGLPLYGTFLLFYMGVLPLPETLAPYWMSSAILVPIVVIVLSRCLDRHPSRKVTEPLHRGD